MPGVLTNAEMITLENGHREHVWAITAVGQSIVPFIPFYGCACPSDPWAFRTKHVYVEVHTDKRTVAIVRFSTLERLSDQEDTV